MQKKKKIIFLVTKSFFGGAQKYVFDLATNLPQDRFEVAVALGGNGPLIGKLEEEGIRIIKIKNFARNISIWREFSLLFELVMIMRKEKPDIVHLNSSKAGGVGALAAKLVGAPRVIFTAHGWAFNEERHMWQKIMIKIIIWVSALWQDKIICVSEKTAADVKNFPLLKKKVEIIYNGIKDYNLLSKEEAREEILKILNLNQNKNNPIWVGTISELHKNKGLEYIIEAISQIKDLPFIFIIVGTGELKENLEKLVIERALEDKIFLVGFLENAGRYLKAFDIFTLTSLTEAFPYSLLEAGVAGLPTITSHVGGIPEILGDGEAGILTKPKDVANIKESLSILVQDANLREKIGSNFRKRIKEKFSLERMLQETTQLY